MGVTSGYGGLIMAKPVVYPTDNPWAPRTFGCHEALHMASVLAEMVEERLVDHPSIMLRSEWRELATRACDALHELYQVIGREHL